MGRPVQTDEGVQAPLQEAPASAGRPSMSCRPGLCQPWRGADRL